MSPPAAPLPAGAASPGARAAAALFAAGVLALGLYGLWFHAALPGRLPSDDDWRRAGERLAREARPGDALVLAPWWAERARLFAPPELPVLAFPRLAGEDLPGVRRVWLLALPRAPGGPGEVERDLAARGARAGPAERLGALALSRYDLAAPTLPAWRLTERFGDATAWLASAPCPREPAGALRCPGPAGPRLARAVREVAFLPRDCAVVEPAPGRPAGAVTLSLPPAPLGRTLRVFAGTAGEPATAGEASAEVRVALDGREVAAAVERPGAPGWHRLEVDTSARAGEAAALALTVRWRAGRTRALCLEAYPLP